MRITIKDNTFQLFAQKAAYWLEQQTLLISDLHIGKVFHFRKAGIAIPAEAIKDNFARLDELMELTAPKRVIFIGDLFHSDVNNEWTIFCDWRKKYATTDMQIVLGNHDRLPDDFCEQFDIAVHQEPIAIQPFIFSHHPFKKFADGEYVISGHIHPAINLFGKANQGIKLPCFVFGSQQAVFPSFGYFTGGHSIKPQENDKIIAVVNNELVWLPNP